MKIETINDWKPEVKSLIKSLTDAGCELISSNNGEDRMQFKGRISEFVEHLIACDEAQIVVKMPDGMIRTLFLVLGNSPGELVCDYGCHDVLDKITDAHYEKWEGRAQPKLRGAYMLHNGKYNFVPEAKAREIQAKQLGMLRETIHNRNLYVVTPEGRRRVVDCHVGSDGHITVRDLYDSNRTYRVAYSKLIDGNENEVKL